MNTKTKTMSVSLVIVNWNTPALTCAAIASVRQGSVVPAEIIVVDNGSGDGSVETIQQQFPSITVVGLNENLGFAKANNFAIREHATQPYVWLLNSDTEVGAHSLEELVQFLDDHDGVGAVGPQLVYPDGSLQSVGGYFPTVPNVKRYLLPVGVLLPAPLRARLHNIGLAPQPFPKEGREIDSVTGAALLLRKKALDEVGLLGEEYFMYFEEMDLCKRLALAGWKRVVIGCDPVMHIAGGSFQKKEDPERLRYFLESLVVFTNKWYRGPRRWGVVFLVRVLGPFSIWLKSRA